MVGTHPWNVGRMPYAHANLDLRAFRVDSCRKNIVVGTRRVP